MKSKSTASWRETSNRTDSPRGPRFRRHSTTGRKAARRRRTRRSCPARWGEFGARGDDFGVWSLEARFGLGGRSFKCDEKEKENRRRDGQGKGSSAPGEKNLRCKGNCHQRRIPMGYIHGRHLALRASLVGLGGAQDPFFFEPRGAAHAHGFNFFSFSLCSASMSPSPPCARGFFVPLLCFSIRLLRFRIGSG